MSWRKLGLAFSPSQGSEWMRSHAQVPTPLLCDGFIRVYFSSRPNPRLSMTSFVDLDADDPTKVLRVNRDPILELGEPGTFDEHGIMPSCAVRDGDRVLLYYSGWSQSTSVPYTNSTGLAISEDGGETFRRASAGPILGKGYHDPFSATSPAVLKADDGWHIWYCSGTGWPKVDGKYEHVYDIKHARSADGVAWAPDRDVAIAQTGTEEAITRPFVTRDADGYHMWFCYRGSRSFRDGEDAYRIGYAHSDDLMSWRREDGIRTQGLGPSESGWDSKMVAYPALLEVGGRTLMFYNGNGFGFEGFGVASKED